MLVGACLGLVTSVYCFIIIIIDCEGIFFCKFIVDSLYVQWNILGITFVFSIALGLYVMGFVISDSAITF